MAVAAAALRPRSAGEGRSLAWSLGAHSVLLLIILLGGVVIPHSPQPLQLGIKATLVDPKSLRRSRPPPVAVPDERPAQPPDADPEQQRAEEQQRQQAAREEAAQQRAAAEQLKAAETQAKQAAAQRKQANEAKVRKEREQKVAEQKVAANKAAQEQQQRDKAEAQRKQAEDKRRRDAQASIDRELEEEEQRAAAADSGALAEYVALIRQKVERNWVRPPSARAGLECEVFVTQIPGGQVTGVRMGRCNADEAVRRSIEAAVLRASPLPAPDESLLFERNLRFTFKPEQ